MGKEAWVIQKKTFTILQGNIFELWLHTESGDVKIRRIFRESHIYIAHFPELENDIWGDGK